MKFCRNDPHHTTQEYIIFFNMLQDIIELNETRVVRADYFCQSMAASLLLLTKDIHTVEESNVFTSKRY